MMRNLLLLPALLALGACGQYSLRNIDKPAPQAYETLVYADGRKVPLLEARRAILECGAPSDVMWSMHYEKALGIKNSDERVNHTFLVSGCLEKSGLIDKYSTLAQDCKKHSKFSTYPACQPGAVFPDRSVERRLNSWSCRLKTDREYCRKNAINPEACDRPEKDYSNPPPECQP